MDLELAGRRALLLGAGRGLGGAAAVALARERASVALVARTRGAVEDRARLCREAGAPQALAIAADATDPAQLERAVHDAAGGLGGLDVLVTLVGGSQPGGAEMDDADWASALDRNLWPAIRATRLALPLLETSARERGALPPASVDAPGSRQQSVVLHVASIWGREGGGSMSYNAAKAGLISLAHEQARELLRRGGAGAVARAGKRAAPGRLLGAPAARRPARHRGVRPTRDPGRQVRHGRGGRRHHCLPLQRAGELDRGRLRRRRRRAVALLLRRPGI